ncbi:hypothetical protein WJX74_007479 [Apatococcus lobatus]|uniref:Uncharacterized protein n=1 Tax=Apatococcus lobatus TaxID=904363 RepID=A0AAW1QC76_9CHLO
MSPGFRASCFIACNSRARRSAVCAGPPRESPQNVDEPVVLPSKDLSPEQTVQVQLEALQNNDHPWPSHGVQTMYEFGEDIGGMERSRYFGYSKDLYHRDHFDGQFLNEFPDLIGHASYKVISSNEQPDGTHKVVVHITAGAHLQNAARDLTFVLKRKDVGRRKGAFMTASLRQM